ncbi:MAG: endonuclease III [Ignavibacteriales bacterium]|nr:endonuclease III [Ignavibacteriales bacterium]
MKKKKETFEEKKERVRSLLKIFTREYPGTKTALQYGNPFQLLVGVILSAQCTDARVNLVTPLLFTRFATPFDFAHADIKELETLIYSTGFYHNKAKNIIACSKVLMEKHHGVVPQTMEELHALPGVGRKTANVVLGDAFGKIEGVVVDTHVTRLANRLGLTKEQDAVKIEKELMSLIPKKYWFKFSHALILHGRKICSARKPLCAQCSVNKFCPSSLV